MASFYIPLSGLNADTTALNTIANNLSNMNTTAYKSQKTEFSSMFAQQIGTTGSGDEIQVGEGVQVASNSTDFTQGGYDTSNTTTSDVAIDGNVFFVLSNGSSNLYTRDGSFTENTNGELVSSDGLTVMGYPATNGVVDTHAALSAITIPSTGDVLAASATTTVSLPVTLNSASDTSATFPATVSVYDSLGTAHTATVTYTKTGTNTWSYSASLPASDFTSGTSTAITGTMTFNSSGTLTTVTPTDGTATTVGTGTTIPLSFTGLADGASDMSISWNLDGSGTTPNITQEASTSTQGTSSQNGYAAGTYESFAIGSDGTVTATYTNGTQVIGQLALADVNNEQGLTLEGNSEYATTLASGTATIGVSGTNGLGTLKDSELEESNVNISAEFSNLIIAQRAFEANSKAITTFDTVTHETINMIQ